MSGWQLTLHITGAFPRGGGAVEESISQDKEGLRCIIFKAMLIWDTKGKTEDSPGNERSPSFLTVHSNPHTSNPSSGLELMARLEGVIGTLVPSLDLRDITHPTPTPSRELVLSLRI